MTMRKKSLIGGLLNRTPVPYVPTRRVSGISTRLHGSGRESQLAAMGSAGILFAIVNRTSTATAEVDWCMYRKTMDQRRRYGSTEDAMSRIEVQQHAALSLWNAPNPFMSRQEFVESFQQHMDLVGESIWVVERDPRVNFPTALWPIRPDKMEPVPDPENFLAGWIYRSPDGEKIPLDVDEVIQLKMPNPEDPYRGMGPVQAILNNIDSLKYSGEWNRNFFINNAEPGGIIEVPDEVGDIELGELKERWNEQHGGMGRAHRVAILEKGLKWIDRNYTMKDMQFSELRQVGREEIREAFGIHKHMLGGSDDVNRANAEAASADFARWLVVPRLERIAGALNHRLLPMFGSTGNGVEFEPNNPIPEDREMENAERISKASAYKTYIDTGVEPEDASMLVGIPPVRHVEKKSVPVIQGVVEEQAAIGSGDEEA